MKPMITRLFYSDDLTPYMDDDARLEEISKQRHEILEQIREILPDEQKELVKKAENLNNEIFSIEAEKSFYIGFRTAAKIFNEAFLSDK